MRFTAQAKTKGPPAVHPYAGGLILYIAPDID